MADLVRGVAGVVGRATGRAWRALAGGRPAGSATASIAVAGEPDVALLASAATLRRLGLRITRYELGDGALEARSADGATLVRIRASADPDAGTRAGSAAVTTLRVVGTGREARPLLRRFRTALARPQDAETEAR